MTANPDPGGTMSRISELSLENFQGVSHRQTIQLGSFSLIYGENSAGKSSIARALLLLSQSLSEAIHIKGDPKNRFFVYAGRYVDLAGFKNVVHKHEEARNLSIGLRVLAENQDRVVVPSLSRSSIEAKSDFLATELVAVAFEVTESVSGLEKMMISFDFKVDTSIENLTLVFQSGPKGTLDLLDISETSPRATRAFLGASGSENFVLDELRGLEFKWSMNWPSLMGTRGLKRGEEPRSSVAQTLEMWLRSARNQVFVALSAPHHIPSLREIEPRVTLRASQPVNSLKLKRLSRLRHAAASNFLSQLTGGRYEIEATTYEMGESGFLGEVEVSFLRDKHLGVAVSFQDVGVGLSQVLPLLTAINSLRFEAGRQLIIAEQPELHLHPKMQAELGELMFRESQSGGQIIAETHSESILLRLQKLVREMSQRAEGFESVAVIYASFNPEIGTVFENLELRNDLDYIVLLPTSFSDLRMEEL